MASCCKHLADVPERFELECIAGRIEEKHRCLFARLAFEPDVGLDHKFCIEVPESAGEFFPLVPFQHHAKMGDRNVMAIDRIGVRLAGRLPAIDQMGNNLVTEKIEIDPAITAAAHPASQPVGIELAGCIEVVDREGKVKWLNGSLAGGHCIADIRRLKGQSGKLWRS